MELDADFISALQKHRARGSYPQPFSFVPFKMKECTEMMNSDSAVNVYKEYLSRLKFFKSHDTASSGQSVKEHLHSKDKDVIHFGVVRSGHFDTVCTNAVTTTTDDVLPVLLWPTTTLHIVHKGKTPDPKSSEIMKKLSDQLPGRIKTMSLDSSDAMSVIGKKCNLLIINGKAAGAKTVLKSANQLVKPDMHFIVMNNMVPGSPLNMGWEEAKGSGKIRSVFSCEFHKIEHLDRYLPTVTSKIAVGRMDYH